MLKRALIGAGLGLALLGGVAGSTHANTPVSAHRAVPADLRVLSTGPQAVDADANAPCGVDATGAQIGNCQDSQNAAGPEDSAGGADSAVDGSAGQADA